MSKSAHQFDWNAIKLRLREGAAALDRAWAPGEQQLNLVYRQRLLDYAHRDIPKTDQGAARRLLVFSLGQDRYGIDLAALVAVFPLSQCTPVPIAPQELLGMINVGGEIRCVIDAACLLGLPATQDREEGHVALLRQAEIEVALRVDRVEAIEEVSPETITTATLSGAEQNGAVGEMRYVEGVAPGRLIVLNVQNLLSHPIFKSDAVEQERN
jgi:chemotaxis signal transduction protein